MTERLPKLAEFVEQEKQKRVDEEVLKQRIKDEDYNYLMNSEALQLLKESGLLLQQISQKVVLSITDKSKAEVSLINLKLMWDFTDNNNLSNKEVTTYSWKEIRCEVARDLDDQIVGVTIISDNDAAEIRNGQDLAQAIDQAAIEPKGRVTTGFSFPALDSRTEIPLIRLIHFGSG